MSDYIKRENALDSLRDGMCGTGYQTIAMDCLHEIFVPSEDVAPVRHGRWIEHYKSDAPPMLKERWICSWCGNVQTYGITDYCPNCGAKMGEEEINE